MTYNVEPTMEATTVRPCGYCGKPVPQRMGAGRPFRYCRDNDGRCQRAARSLRMRERTAPGLAGQIARVWEVVERLETVGETLAETLHSELSPAGVERQVAEVQADTAHRVAAAHTERDSALEALDAERRKRRRAAEEAAAATARAEAASHAATATEQKLSGVAAQLEEARIEVAGHTERLAAAAAANERLVQRLGDVERERDAVRATAERAETRAHQLTEQVTNLSAALGRLGVPGAGTDPVRASDPAEPTA